MDDTSSADLLLGYRTWTQAGGASPLTLALRCHYLIRLAAAWPDRSLLDLAPGDLATFLARAGWKPETRRSARSALKSFYRWACDTELLARDPTRMLPQVKVPAGKARPTPDLVFARALVGADQRGRRLMMLAGYAGLRRAEIAKVHSDDIIDGELRVVGKGSRVRLIPLHPLIVAELASAPGGWLFPNGYGSHLTSGHVGVLLKRLLGPGWSAHTLRHRFATRAYAVDRDLLAVQELLGHSKPETTRIYVVVPDGALRTAVLGAA